MVLFPCQWELIRCVFTEYFPVLRYWGGMAFITSSLSLAISSRVTSRAAIVAWCLLQYPAVLMNTSSPFRVLELQLKSGLYSLNQGYPSIIQSWPRFAT